MEQPVALPASKFSFGEDRISQLPHEILVSIVSMLAMKEAARTSALSRRWRHLWTFSTGDLNFQASKPVWEMKSLRVERFKFIGWVNRVLDLHQASNITQFRVCFDLNKRSQRYIDDWVSIAMGKKVQNLELDFTPFLDVKPALLYTFPRRLCNLSSGCSFQFLKSLSLKYVNFSEVVLEYFLSNCPLLELLSVVSSERLVTLKVVGSFPRLKHLYIYNCDSLERVEICAVNLLSFGYSGRRTVELDIVNAHQLVDLSISAKFCQLVKYVFCPLSTYLCRLKTLMLGMHIFEEDLEFPQLPVFSNLQHLIWRVHAPDGRSLLGLTSLIEASPFLQRFTLEFIWSGQWGGSWRQRIAKKAVKCPNQHLKVVEILGFLGHTIDIELAIYLIENAIKLEKIIIDHHSPYKGAPFASMGIGNEQAARRCAQKLETKLPPGAELVIL